MISGQDIYLFLSYILHENIIKNIIICKFNRFHEDSPITPVKKGFFFFSIYMPENFPRLHPKRRNFSQTISSCSCSSQPAVWRPVTRGHNRWHTYHMHGCNLSLARCCSALLAPGCHERPARQPAACSSDPFQAAALEKFKMASSQPSLSSFRRPTQADETHKAGTSQGLKSPAKTAAGLKILLTWMHTVRSRGKQQQQKLSCGFPAPFSPS